MRTFDNTIALSHVTFCCPPLSSFHHAYGVEAVVRCCETSGSKHLDSSWQISISPGPDVSIPSGGFGQALLPSRLLSSTGRPTHRHHAYQRTTTAGSVRGRVRKYWDTSLPRRVKGRRCRRSYFVPTNDSVPPRFRPFVVVGVETIS